MRTVLAGAAAAALLAGCGGGGTSSAQTTTASQRFHYSKALQQSYMSACTRGGAVKEPVCACTLDKLSESVSTQDFRRMSLSGVIPARIRTAINRAVQDCRKA